MTNHSYVVSIIFEIFDSVPEGFFLFKNSNLKHPFPIASNPSISDQDVFGQQPAVPRLRGHRLWQNHIHRQANGQQIRLRSFEQHGAK